MSEIIPSKHEMEVFNQMAQAASKSPIYKRWGGFEGILMILLTARELGLPPMMSLNGGINNILGKIELSARSMNGLIRRAGHQVITITSGDTICTLKGVRADTKEEMEVSFFIEEAKKMGLLKQGSAWEKTPNDMLYARALSRLARRLFPDVIGTCYVEGEIPRTKSDEIDVIEDLSSQTISGNEVAFLNDLIGDDQETKDKLLTHYQIKSFEELRADKWDSVMVSARNYINRLKEQKDDSAEVA